MTNDLRILRHPLLGPDSEQKMVSITFDGVEIPAIEGEPVAAALLANGIRGCRTLPGSGGPRGVFTGVGRSLEELGMVDGEANVQLMTTLVRDGITVETQEGLGAKQGST